MVNSASQSIAEFKSKRMGGLLNGFSSTVSAPSIIGTTLSGSASERMARSAPKKSSTAFMDNIRKSGERQHATFMQGIQQKTQAAAAAKSMSPGAALGAAAGSRIPSGPVPKGANGTVAYGGRYGLQVPASNSFTDLENKYRQQFGSGFVVNDGWRSYENQVKAMEKHKAGGPKAATPGTSNHGWGTAVDLGGPIGNANSAQHAWLRQNAAQFGWYWVGQRYGEPWHWEYRPQ